MTIQHSIDAKLRSRIRSALRKVWMYSPARRAVKTRARVKKGVYQCEECGKLTDKVDIDHIEPIGATPGSRNSTDETTWDLMITRMFCMEENMQAICKECHSGKTNESRHKDRASGQAKGSKQKAKSKSKTTTKATKAGSRKTRK